MHPETYEFLSKDGMSASSEHFEAATAKIQAAVQKHEESARLKRDEKGALVTFLKKPTEDSDGDDGDDDEVHVQESFTRGAYDEYGVRVLKKSKVELPYVDTSVQQVWYSYAYS